MECETSTVVVVEMARSIEIGDGRFGVEYERLAIWGSGDGGGDGFRNTAYYDMGWYDGVCAVGVEEFACL